MVRALKARQRAGLRFDDGRPAMPADVVKTTQRAVVTAGDDEVFASHWRQEVLPRGLCVFDVTNADPATGKPCILLVVEDLLVVERTGRQHAGLQRRPPYSGDLFWSDWRPWNRTLPGHSGRVDHQTLL